MDTDNNEPDATPEPATATPRRRVFAVPVDNRYVGPEHIEGDLLPVESDEAGQQWNEWLWRRLG